MECVFYSTVMVVVVIPLILPVALVLSPIVWLYLRVSRRWGFNTDTSMRKCVYDANSPGYVKVVSGFVPLGGKQDAALVKIIAAGVNPVDCKCVVGDKGFPEGWLQWWAHMFAGQSVGFDFSGIIVEAPSSSVFAPGDRVFGLQYHYFPNGIGKFGGSICEYALVPLDQLWKTPEKLSHVQAAALPLVGVTALQAIEQHHVGHGQRVLVIGASGGLGHCLTQLCSTMRCTVTGICSTKNIEFVRSCGASYVIDYQDKSKPLAQALRDHVSAHGDFDVVFDTVSSADSRDRKASYPSMIRHASPSLVKSHKAGRADGVDAHNYVVFGGEFIMWIRALVKRLLRITFFPRGFELFWIVMPKSRKYLQQLQDLCDNEGVRPRVMKVYVLIPYRTFFKPYQRTYDTTPRLAHSFPFTSKGVQEAFTTCHPPPGQKRSTQGKLVVGIALEAHAQSEKGGLSKDPD